jgi:DNA (cytosine-5)-methyltransferase 1
LWFELLRVIKELQPTWFVGENVKGLITKGLDEVLGGLEGAGYSVQTYCIPACSIGAPHQRERVFIVAHCNNTRGGIPKCKPNGNGTEVDSGWKQLPFSESGRQGEVASHSDMQHWQKYEHGNQLREESRETSTGWSFHDTDWDKEWTGVATRLCRVDDGIPYRMDRLTCLGNAVVPAQAFPILQAIAQIEKGEI